jgi:large subunit ribosomal protein L3
MENIIKGKKIQMSQVFIDNGNVIPVTVISTESDLTEEMNNKDVVIVGTSKGKGFTGVMKRWNFAGVGEATRGQSNKQRSGGSIGSQTPGRVYKGKKMAGRTGNKRVTVKGSRIVQINAEKKEIMVSGPVPGARNAQVTVKFLG